MDPQLAVIGWAFPGGLVVYCLRDGETTVTVACAGDAELWRREVHRTGAAQRGARKSG